MMETGGKGLVRDAKSFLWFEGSSYIIFVHQMLLKSKQGFGASFMHEDRRMKNMNDTCSTLYLFSL